MTQTHTGRERAPPSHVSSQVFCNRGKITACLQVTHPRQERERKERWERSDRVRRGKTRGADVKSINVFTCRPQWLPQGPFVASRECCRGRPLSENKDNCVLCMKELLRLVDLHVHERQHVENSFCMLLFDCLSSFVPQMVLRKIKNMQFLMISHERAWKTTSSCSLIFVVSGQFFKKTRGETSLSVWNCSQTNTDRVTNQLL